MPFTDEATFNTYFFQGFLNSEKGEEYLSAQDLGIDLSTGRLKFMRIAAQSVGVSTASRAEKLPLREGWDKYVQDFAEKDAPEGLKIVYQEADVFWAWMQSEQAFFDGVQVGVTISAICAFFILLIATRNLLISLYAIITVIFIVMSVVAVMVLRGWQLGVSESIAMVIIIGFSVDYVVHLAAHYVHAAPPLRYDRAHDSIASMGVSIFSGAMTTLGSGVFLFGGTIIFFQKFALIITMTVLFSLSFALVYFLAFLHAFGP